MKLSFLKIALLMLLFHCKPGNISAQNTLAQNTKAQNTTLQKIKPVSLANTWWVQYNPLTLTEPEVPITATIHYKTNGRIAIALDAGFFIAKQNYSDNGFTQYNGFRLKPAIKYYLQGYKKSPHGLYFSLEGLLKRTINKKQEWLSQTNSTGQSVFSQLANYKERKLVYGINLLFGGEIILDKEQRWMLDLYLGLGIRNKQFKANNLPTGLSVDYSNDNSNRVFNIFLNGTYMSVPAGLKVGYRIK